MTKKTTKRKTWKRIRKASVRLIDCQVRLLDRKEDNTISTVIGLMPQNIYPGGVILHPNLAGFGFWNVADLEARR